jgi:hypothetical protein
MKRNYKNYSVLIDRDTEPFAGWFIIVFKKKVNDYPLSCWFRFEANIDSIQKIAGTCYIDRLSFNYDYYEWDQFNNPLYLNDRNKDFFENIIREMILEKPEFFGFEGDDRQYVLDRFDAFDDEDEYPDPITL